jgi:hypothetical protein
LIVIDNWYFFWLIEAGPFCEGFGFSFFNNHEKII